MSQYQPVVRYRPCAVCNPRLWMSLMKASRAAGFIVLEMPNSIDAFSELVKSLPALDRPRICAFDACACSRNDEKSDAESGTRTEPTTLPPCACTTFVAASCSW